MTRDAKASSQHKIQASDPDDKLPFWRAVRRYPRLVGYCFAVTTAILGWGYASVLVSSVNNIDQFLFRFGEEIDGDWQIPGMWQSVWMACDAGGGAIGAAAGGWLQDRFGRRMSMIIGGVWSAIGVVTVFVADVPGSINGRRGMFLVGKMTAGFATGIIKTTAMTYVSENSPTALRGSAMALFPTFTLLGQAIGTGVIMGVRGIPLATNYRIAFSTEWFFSILAVGLGIFLPESPSHLIRKNHMTKAVKSARKLYAPHASPEHELERIIASVRKETESTRRPGYLECFRGVNARRTWIIIFTNVLPALFGLDLLSQASYFLLTIGMPSKTGLLFQLLGIALAIFANAASIWLLSRIGRRTATIPSLAAATLLWTAMGVAGFFTGLGAQYLTAGSMIAVILVCGLGAWPAGYAIMGETSSLSLRAKSQAIGGIAAQMTSVVMNFGLPLLFSRDGANLGSKTGFVYTALCGVAVLTSWLYIPEMKGRSALEIDHMFAIGLPARRFKSWTGVASVPA
ncbi:general substrate transporter [Microdochium bolleyi]|uniref:General substrate transporter n=1 Tax=Microdochium bolleyi TaxID=196109 RepID=A0A136IQA6_9PEZI|nr:general substrate transporter [Microdochium bolleyi]